MTYNKMKILFIGTVEFSFKALSILVENNFEIVGLITKQESKLNADFYDLTPFAETNNIPIFYRTKSNQVQLISFINSQSPDVIYCFGWSHILTTSILTIPKYGVVGFHPAALPNNRGRHPIIWALFLGLKQTASTFFIMDEGADTGDIIAQEKVEIDNDDASSLYEKIINVALKQILSFTKNLENKDGKIDKIVQNKNQGNSWRKRGKLDGKIDFRMSSIAILNLVRALTYPYVGSHIEYLGDDIKVWEVKEENSVLTNYEPGKVLEVEGNELIVKTYDGAIRIIKHEFKELPIKGEYL